MNVSTCFLYAASIHRVDSSQFASTLISYRYIVINVSLCQTLWR